MPNQQERLLAMIRDHESRLRFLERQEIVARAGVASNAELLGGLAASALDVDKVDGYHAADLLPGVEIDTYYDATTSTQNFTQQSFTSSNTSQSVDVVDGDVVLAVCAFDWRIDLARGNAAKFGLSVGGTLCGGGHDWGNPYSGEYMPGVVVGHKAATGTATWTVELQVYVSESGRTITTGDVQLLTVHIH